MIIDFIFSYTTDVLQDAQAFSEATGNAQGTVGQQDVELAIHSRMDMSLAQSPNLEVRYWELNAKIGRCHATRAQGVPCLTVMFVCRISSN